jgi:hypothetical protein
MKKRKVGSLGHSKAQSSLEFFIASGMHSGTSGGAQTTEVSNSNVNYALNYTQTYTVNHVEGTWAEIQGKTMGDTTFVAFKEMQLQSGQSIPPIDPALLEIDPQKITEKTRQPIPIEAMQSLKESAEILYRQIADSNRQLNEIRYVTIQNELANLRAKIERMGSPNQQQFSRRDSKKLSKRETSKLSQLLSAKYADIQYLDSISLEPIPEGIQVSFYHSLENASRAVDEIIDLFVEVQKAFPQFYMEPRVMPKSQVGQHWNKDSRVIRMKE